MQKPDDIDSEIADLEEDTSRHGLFPNRRSFDGLLIPFTTRCLKAPPDQLDQEIKQGLEEVNSFFGSDRVILWEISSEGLVGILTHSHAESGTNPPISVIPQKTLPYIFNSLQGLKNLCVSRLKDLPKDALIDLQYLEKYGIRSFMVIPLLVGGIIHGALSLSYLRTEREWSAEDLFQFQRIGSILSGVLDRKRSHQLLDRRIQFETLITNLSAQLIKAPMNEVDGEIFQALAQVREFFQADRCALLGIRSDGKVCWVTHASYGEGVEPVSGAINLAELFPWSYEQLTKGKMLNLCRVEDYPEEALIDRQSHVAFGIKSALNIPLAVEGRISRTIVINHTCRHQIWPIEYISRLRLLGDIFVNALERCEDRLKLEEALRFKTLLSEISARFINLTADQVDDEIENAQLRICELLDLDRSSLWQVVEGKPETMFLTKLHNPSGNLPSPPRPMDGREFFPWTIQRALIGETFTISKMSDLPPEADRDRESYRIYGTKSVVIVPLLVGEGPVLGLLTFAVMREERDWTENSVMGFKLITQMFANALARKQAELVLRNRLRFELMISSLSARFMAIPFDVVENEINHSLGQILEYFQVDLCALLEVREDKALVKVSHAVYGDGIEPLPKDKNLAELYPWSYGKLMRGEHLKINRAEDFPDEALIDRQSDATMGTISRLASPVAVGGRISRIITIHQRHRQQSWPEEYVPRLRLLGEILVNALERRQDRLQLEEQLKFEMLLVEISERFVNLPSDQADGEIVDAQRRVCEFLELDLSALWQWSTESTRILTLTHLYRPLAGPPIPEPMVAHEHFPWCQQQMEAGRIIALSSIEDAPVEAAQDKEVWRFLGIKSTLIFPLSLGGKTVFGALSFNALRRERHWPESLIKRLQLVAQMFTNALIRKQTDMALRESETRLSLTTDAVGAGLWIMEVDTGKVWVSPKSRELFHFAPNEKIGYESYFKVIHPEDRDRVHQEVQQAIQSGMRLRCDFRILLPDGTPRWIVAHGQRLLKTDREPERLMGLSLDITRRKQAEEALEDRFCFEGLVLDLSARFVNVPSEQLDLEIEHALQLILGFFQFDRIALVRLSRQKATWQVTHAAFATGVTTVPVGVDLPAALFPWVFEKLATHSEVLSFSSLDEFPLEAAIDRQSCEEWGIKSYLSIPICAGTPLGYAVIINAIHAARIFPTEYFPRIRLLGEILVNVLERRHAETEAAHSRAELLHVERTLHLSELTGSLAHELNQPLAAILSNAQAALRFLKSDNPDLNEFQEIIQDIIADDQRAGNVIRSLRSMMKREEGEKKPIPLNDILIDVIQIFRGEALLRNMQVETQLDESLPPVFGDPGQLQQVMLNLIMNGMEAMSRNPSGQRKLILRTQRKDSSLRVTVRDFGPGIAQENLERVFEPFFTTKNTGLGMGLAVCRSIIKAHRGHLWAENNPAGGAAFFFELPIYDIMKEQG
jgi:PAS domain S-box-containing protein